MADRIAPLRLGVRVCFADRWQGHVSGLEVDEDWNVLNISVASGFLFARRSVRLPFTSVTSWSDESVRIAANSFHAFGRQIPPVAAPARPVSSGTPVSNTGTKFAGLVIWEAERRAAEVILSRGVAGLFRVPVGEVSFTGKTMTVSVQPEQLIRYRPDSEIHDELHSLVADDQVITTDDKRHIKFDVEGGVATLSGNVRVDQTHDYVAGIAASAPGVMELRNELRVDFEIEGEIGLALNVAGLQRDAQVYVRSNYGEVQVDGLAASQRAIEDIVRAVARVPGVRSVINRLRVRPTAAANAS